MLQMHMYLKVIRLLFSCIKFGKITYLINTLFHIRKSYFYHIEYMNETALKEILHCIYREIFGCSVECAPCWETSYWGMMARYLTWDSPTQTPRSWNWRKRQTQRLMRSVVLQAISSSLDQFVES